MKLYEFYNAWDKEGYEEFKIFDNNSKYYHNYIPKELRDREVKSFYFYNNSLVVRI